LARILQPADFGLVAIAMTLVSVVEAALKLPLNQALLRLPVTTAAQYDTAFTLSALRGLLLTLIVVLASWPFARSYVLAPHRPRLGRGGGTVNGPWPRQPAGRTWCGES